MWFLMWVAFPVRDNEVKLSSVRKVSRFQLQLLPMQENHGKGQQ